MGECKAGALVSVQAPGLAQQVRAAEPWGAPEQLRLGLVREPVLVRLAPSAPARALERLVRALELAGLPEQQVLVLERPEPVPEQESLRAPVQAEPPALQAPGAATVGG